MQDRVYVLLDVAKGKAEDVARSLEGKRGVTMVDVLENPFGVMIVIEASGRRSLAELTVEALASVETMTDGLVVLPARCSALSLRSLN